MGADYAEKEREFVSALADETGKDLHDWMAAIAASGLNERNAIIEWLRHQGFAFSQASWLERIHHNDGRLIYAGDASAARGGELEPPSPVDPEPEKRPPEASLFRGRPILRLVSSSAPPEPSASPQPGPWRPSAEIAALLAPAKGLRPLAELVLREIAAAPSVRLEARAPLIVAMATQPFAALWPQPKALRLYGEFGAGAPFDVRPAESTPRLAAPFAQMIVLDDARRVDQAFRRLMVAMAGRAQS